MVRPIAAVAVAAALVAGGLSAGSLRTGAPSPVAADAKPDDAATTCVKWWPEVRSTGLGYKHVVVLSNGCKKPATCKVSSDVNPDPQTVTVAPGALEEVVTFLESPASTFVPNVSCKVGS